VDFALGETQEAVATLAARVLGQGRGGQRRGGQGQGRPDPRPLLPDGYDCALWKELGQAGLLSLAAALALTTTYIGTREQFGRPLAAFQAVSQQVADVYVVARTLHLAALSACWRLETGREAAGDLDVAAYWLAERAPAALRTCHHLHGGIGMDVTYPLHRYSSLIKDMVRFVGGADYRLDALRSGIIE
jgi:3-oxo-4-pregnene-20-carboxyl-CoA dehydrogenase alpha subunit